MAGQELQTTVYPFILRGISLLGIDSVQCPVDVRRDVWTLLANEWGNKELRSYTEECTLEELDEKFTLILQGRLKGRTVINMNEKETLTLASLSYYNDCFKLILPCSPKTPSAIFTARSPIRSKLLTIST